MDLRDYQQNSVDLLAKSLRSGRKAPILVISTGSGKTRIAAAICNLAKIKSNKVLFLAPRRGLVFQTNDSFYDLGIDSGIVMAGEEYDNRHLVDVASMDTVIARINKEISNDAQASVKEADIIIVDEAHTSVSSKRKAFLQKAKDGEYGKKIIIGLTASPCVSGGGGLGAIYDDLIIPITMGELIEKGYLSPARYFSAEKPDLSNVGMTAGEYNQKGLGDAYSNSIIMGDVLKNWRQIAENTKTVVFTPTRATAAELVERFNEAGYLSEYVDANTKDKERARIYERLNYGETKAIMNVGIISMGVDIPNIQTVVMATATKSVAKWMQAIGRAMRPAKDKECCYIIDHGGMTLDPKMGQAEDIVDWSLDVKEKIQDRILERKKEKQEPKEITCSKCKTVFKARRDCPACGHAMKQPTESLEYYEADLKEIKKNNKTSWPEKIKFMGQLKKYADDKGFKTGWAAHKYKEKFGVFPNDPRVKHAPAISITSEVIGFITSRNIAWSKRRII